ncbi:serine/threonine kinase [Pelomyxa schiedti]|nr:serine/threonine kinase [Pelomyxa schiedti]
MPTNTDRNVVYSSLNDIQVGDPEKYFENVKKRRLFQRGTAFTADCVITKAKVTVKTLQISCGTVEQIGEVMAQKKYTHPNFVAYIDSFRTKEEIWVITEYISGGTLADLIDGYELFPLDENHMAYICREIVHALVFLQHMRAVHLAINSDNIFLTPDGAIKIGDFGTVQKLLGRPRCFRPCVIGTPYWTAPEVIRGQEQNGVADVWSLGILCMEMAAGEPPYMDYPPVRALLSICTQGAPALRSASKWSPLFVEFVALCLHPNSHARPTASGLLTHPFLHRACESHHLASLMQIIHKAALG